jgi:hypothetical protein
LKQVCEVLPSFHGDLSRWPNGDCSIVSASTNSDAIELLDEWGNAEQATLTRMADCMFDFRLDDSGNIELADIGEVTYDHIMRTCYPDLDKTTAERDDAGQAYSEKGAGADQGSGRIGADAAVRGPANPEGSENPSRRAKIVFRT